MNNFGARLEFDLPSQSDAHYCALNGQRYRKVIRNLDYFLDTQSIKLDPVEKALLEGVRNKIKTFLQSEGVLLYGSWNSHGQFIGEESAHREIRKESLGTSEGKQHSSSEEPGIFLKPGTNKGPHRRELC